MCKIIINHRNTLRNFSFGGLYEVVADVCKIGNLDIYKFYLDVIIEQRLNYKFPPTRILSEACESGNILLVKYIFKNNIYDILLDLHGEWNNYLQCACKSCNIEVIEMIIMLGGDLWYDGDKDWNGGLYYACKCKGDNIEIVKLMIEKGADSFDRCLNMACFAGNLKIIDFIINQGPTNWNEIICDACAGGHMDIVELVIKKGSDNWNEGMRGACRGGHLDIVKYMVSKGANNWNESVISTSYDNIEIIKFLVSQGATNFDVCLVHACFLGDIDFAKLMIEKGATANWNIGLTNACKNSHVEIVKLMIEKGANNLDGSLRQNLTGNTNVLTVLLNNGAKVDNINYYDTHSFRLFCLCSKNLKKCNKYMDLLLEYPPCVLFVGSRLSANNNCHIKKLPIELFKFLCSY